MTKILFVCHGNICRSPMAHHIFTHLVKEAGREKEFYIDSAATHTDALGCDTYPPAKRKLHQEGILLVDHVATLLERRDYEKYDYIFGMDSANIRNMLRLFGGDPQGKIHRLLDFTGQNRDVADPWYTGNFDETYEDVITACKILLEKL